MLLSRGWLLKTGPIQWDGLLSVPAMLHMPVWVPALIELLLGTAILFPQCHYSWLRVLRAGTPGSTFPWFTHVSFSRIAGGQPWGFCQPQPSMVPRPMLSYVTWVTAPGCPFPVGGSQPDRVISCCCSQSASSQSLRVSNRFELHKGRGQRWRIC